MADPDVGATPGTTSTKAPASKATVNAPEVDTHDVTEDYVEAKDAENEKNDTDDADNPMSDATADDGTPIVGVTPDLFRPVPAEGAPAR